MEASNPEVHTDDPSQEGTLSPEEVAAERERVLNEREAELDKREKALNTPPSQRARSEAEEADNAAVQARRDQGWYCPGCGKPSAYPRECVGTPTAPHPAIEVVKSDELDGDPANLTVAPSSENLG